MRIDHEESVKYYRSDASIPCKCAYCKNYVLQIEKEYPRVCAYLRTMSIDALRPFELFLPVEMKYGRLEYFACQYIAFGSCESPYTHKIDDVIFRETDFHPGTRLEGIEHFVIEFGPIFLEIREPSLMEQP